VKNQLIDPLPTLAMANGMRAAQSVLLRYHGHNGLTLDASEIAAATIREEISVVQLMDYRGVPIYMLDETSGMASHTFESLVAAVTVAHCMKLGYRHICFSSGGNLGEALTLYARQAGIKTFSFNPQVNVSALDGRIFSKGLGHWLIGVRDAQKNREIALDFSHRAQKALGHDPMVPDFSWRSEALSVRGLFLLDYMLENNLEFEAITQTISAGFGPLAIYDTLFEAELAGQLKHVPRFIGVQQEANCFMYQKWKKTVFPLTSELIVPTLFDHNPDHSFGTFPAFQRMLEESHGDMVTINWREFERYITPKTMGYIREQGLFHTIRDGQYVARSGLMALAGTLKAIDQGLIRQGPVLHCMCDGVRPGSLPAEAAAVVDSPADLDELVHDFINL
jgi:hypothetical protein